MMKVMRGDALHSPGRLGQPTLPEVLKGQKSFRVWHNKPSDIAAFCRKLKTELYPPSLRTPVFK